MKRLLNILPLLFVMLVAFAGPAAAQSSWLPSYNAAQKVYISPGVDASFEGTYATQAFRTDIERAARVHNLDVYVIITASGNDAGSDARQAGPVLVRKLWTRWTADVAFNSERALIVLMTGDGQTLTSVGVRAGGYLNARGIMRATMDNQNGPVIPVLRSYLASDPASVPVRIVNNINDIVTSKLTPPANLSGGNQPTVGTNEGDNSMGIGTILLIAGVIIFGVFLIRFMFPPRRPSSTYTPSTPTARTTSLRKPGSGFEGRLSDSRRNRTGGAAAGADGADVDDDNLRRHDNNDGINTATALGVGVAAGVLLSEANRRNDDEPRRDSGSSDSGYVAPVVSAPSCSTPSSSDSGSSSAGSSCSSGGSSCGGGGGGGGCGGGAG